MPRRLNTSYIERYNLTDRTLVAYKCRETPHLARGSRYYDTASCLAITYYNFSRAHRSLPLREGGGVRFRTPAQAARITDHRWTLRELLSHPEPVGRHEMKPPVLLRVWHEEAPAVLASQGFVAA